MLPMLAEIDWNPGTITVVLIFGIPIVAIVTEAWRKIEQSRSLNDLKRSMVERGMSADEIERVITAQTPKK